MRGELEIFATGGVIGLRLDMGKKMEVITEDYRGETIVFSNEIEIEVLGIDGDDLRDRDPPITCQSLRLFMTPLRDDMYVEIDDDYYNQVYLMPIEQELFVSKATIGFNSDEARPSFTCELERGVSIFEDFNTEKIVNITLDKNYETIWTSNIGPRTRGRNFKVQFRGMYVYYKLRKMIFETFFDELQFSFNSDETLKIKLLVQGREVLSHNITYKSVQGAVYNYRFIIKEDIDDDTSDGTSEESSDDEGGGESKSGPLPTETLPPAETPPGMVRINGFLTPRPASPPPAAPPMPRRRRLRPRRRNPNETTTRFQTDFMAALDAIDSNPQPSVSLRQPASSPPPRSPSYSPPPLPDDDSDEPDYGNDDYSAGGSGPVDMFSPGDANRDRPPPPDDSSDWEWFENEDGSGGRWIGNAD